MRGIFALSLALAFVLVLAGMLVREMSLYAFNGQMIRRARLEYEAGLRRDVELSIRRALLFALDEFDGDLNALRKRAEEYVGMAVRAWAGKGVNITGWGAGCVEPELRRDAVRVYITCPLEGNVGSARIYIPSGFYEEVER